MTISSAGLVGTPVVAINAVGNSYFNAGNVGIGITNPTAKLDVFSLDPVIARFTGVASTFYSYLEIYLNSTTNGGIEFRVPADGFLFNTGDPSIGENANALVIKQNGLIGIGTLSPVGNLQIGNGTAGTRQIQFQSTDWAGQRAAISWGSGKFSLVRMNNAGDAVSVNALTIDYSQNGLIGLIGIGTTNPVANLEIVGAASANATLRITANANNDYHSILQFATAGTSIGNIDYCHYVTGGDTYNYMAFNAGGSERMRIQAQSGNVGIGITNPSYKLQLSTDSAAKPGTNTWTIASDIRLKKDIRPYTNGLSIVRRINPVWFKYNGKAGLPQDNQNHIGVIGQEIIKVAPYTVDNFWAKLNPEDKKPTKFLNFNSHALTFDLINAVKELDANITKLAQENQELKKVDKELKSELESIKTRLSRLEAKVK